ncbi:MAG: hypothetical protein V3S04_02325 [Candidatus Omnitrophota bacterium]
MRKKGSTMNKKGLILLSGGLDSTLAAKILLEQGIELEAINFLTCFCTCTKKGCRNEATKVSEKFGLKLKILNVTKEYLEVIQNPKHGYGRNLNPCLDCRIFMFKKAKEYMKEIGASFIVTGEVLGERPMSQRPNAIAIIERESGLKGAIVRPLSAKHFEPSTPEKEGIIERDKLLDIQGRSRKQQIGLAQHYNITDYPCPAGGCLLTDPGFASRARDLLRYNTFSMDNILLLKVGRHFRLNPKDKLVVGRNEEENERILAMARPADMLFEPKDIPGPVGLLRGEGNSSEILTFSSSIIARYSDSKKETVIIYRRYPQDEKIEVAVLPAEETVLQKVRL